MENDGNDQETMNEIQALLSGEKKKKKAGFFSRKKRPVKEETKIRVKTIMDIPPLVNARRNIGNNDLAKAATDAKRDAQKDIEKYFQISLSGNLPLMAAIINQLENQKIDISSEALVDNDVLVKDVQKSAKGPDDSTMVMTLRKFSSFLSEIYLPTIYSQAPEIDGQKLLSLITDVYNYMDVKKLYYIDE